jgi:peptidoglycan hydrolase-like protein with peptidoglycan-binding domain
MTKIGENPSVPGSAPASAPVGPAAPSFEEVRRGEASIAPGQQGDAVRLVQQALIARGYALEPSGVFDAATVQAVKRFQSANALTANGVVGPLNLAKLLPPAPGIDEVRRGDKALEPGQAGPMVSAVQQALVAHGYAIAVSGFFDAATQAAAKSFQLANGLKGDGLVGPITLSKLMPAGSDADRSRAVQAVAPVASKGAALPAPARTAKAAAPAAPPPPPVVITDAASKLSRPEQSMAVQVFTALLDHRNEVHWINFLLGVGGTTQTAASDVVTVESVNDLADAARRAGYPLTPDGIDKLKKEAGIGEPGIGPGTAKALLGRIALSPAAVGGEYAACEAYLQKIAPAAQQSDRQTNVPASASMAQNTVESNWGAASIKSANNYFGIKGTGPAGSVTATTQEFIHGQWITVKARFRAYASMEECFADHARLLSTSPVYSEAMKVADDPKAFARALQQAGYATAPNYARALIARMDAFNLYRFDVPPPPPTFRERQTMML